MKRSMVSILILFAILLLSVTAVNAGFLRVNNMKLDPNHWGERHIIIPIENPSQDSARMTAELTITYPNHYLSGTETEAIDTSFIIESLFTGKKKFNFYLNGSFGRARMALVLKWKHVSDDPETVYDSTVQIFSNNFSARGDARGLVMHRYPIGPMGAMSNYNNLSYEYPRLVLYLTSRGTSIKDLNKMFRSDTTYTKAIIDEFRKRGLYPADTSYLNPAVLAISESEGFTARPKIMNFAAIFSEWYLSKGEKQLNKYLADAAIDSAAADIQALKMQILYHALLFEWGTNTEYKLGERVNLADDLRYLNTLHWIVQGGEFFQPRVCMSAFTIDSTNLILGAFRPDQTLVCSKLALTFMYDRAKWNNGVGKSNLPEITIEQFSALLNKAQKGNLVDNLTKKLRQTIADVKGDLGFYSENKEYFLADYIVRITVGNCFKDLKDYQLKRFVLVRY
ncbi:MAG: hypothetical protein KAR42_10105 [candidate division Zixibacteria bacterium]|nr:hypothetical protein [candidate division Zixibacteria bacterium]